MNDPLAEAIAQAILAADDDNPAWELGILGHKELGQVAALAVRAWLALPPSEDEIEMAAIVLRRQIGVGGMPDDPFEVAEKSWHETSTDEARARFRRVAKAVLVASHAVLVRPPEVEKGTS